MREDEEVLRKIENKSKKIFLPIIGKEKGELLRAVVKSETPKTILEIGTLVGYSAIIMARESPKSKITCLEISEKFALIAEKHFKEARVKNAKIIIGDALDTIPKLKGKYNLVFIDAAKENYFDYLKLIEQKKLVGSGSVIVADNVKIFKKEVKAYLSHVRTSGYYQSQYFDFGEDGMEVSIKL